MNPAHFDVAVCDCFPHLAPVFDRLCERLSADGRSFRRFASHQALLADPAALAGARVIAGFGGMRVDAAVLDRAPRLTGIVSVVSGTEGLDTAAANAAGVLIAHAPTEENVRSIAESALLLMLHLMYDLDGTRDNLRLNRPRPNPVRARMLKGKTIGLVGWGRIAQVAAELLAPWQARVVVHSRRDGDIGLPAGVQRATSLDALMAEADIVCVLAGAQAGSGPLIDARRLALMKRDAYFINLSRGVNVDEAALVEALRARAIAGAALDVFAVEPLAADSPLRGLDNVVLTPHHVGHTREGDDSLEPALQNNVLALLRGEAPPFLRNPEALPAWRDRLAG
jgi:phosphoglycerate dehydrogenase-like enzyme